MNMGWMNGGWREKYFISKQVHDEDGNMTGIRFTDPEAQYFVMRFDQDPHARVAMRAYAESVRAENPDFDKDIRRKLLETHNTPGGILDPRNNALDDLPGANPDAGANR